MTDVEPKTEPKVEKTEVSSQAEEIEQKKSKYEPTFENGDKPPATDEEKEIRKYIDEQSKDTQGLKDDDFVKNMWYQGYKTQFDNLKKKYPEFLDFYAKHELHKIHTKDLAEGAELASKYAPQHAYGRDRQGHYILYNCLSKYDFSNISKNQDKILEAYIQMMIKLQRKSKEATKSRGVRQHKLLVIVDMYNIGLMTATWHRKLIMLFIGVLQNWFPETLFRLYVVNGGAAFRGIWTMVKPWLDPVTVAKIKIKSSDFINDLLKDVSKEEIHVDYGGTSKIKPVPYQIIEPTNTTEADTNLPK